MNTSPNHFVDPFHGNVETTLEFRPGGSPAAGWQWLKALPGNTHPGACSPFGVMSVCAYTGGYPTGYTPYQLNACGVPPRLIRNHEALGMTHIHPSGIGSTGQYHNYLLVTPFTGEKSPGYTAWPLENEEAGPGYYGAVLGRTGVKMHATVSPHCAWHHAEFPANFYGKIRLDLLFSYQGDPRFIDDMHRRGLKTDAEGNFPCLSQASAVIRYADHHTMIAEIQLTNMFAMYVYCEATDARGGGYWAQSPSGGALTEGSIREVFFLAEASGPVELKIGLSLQSVQQAKQFCESELADNSFEEARMSVGQEWEKQLQRIEVADMDCGIEKRTLLYTSLYRSLLKPMDFTGDSPLWAGDKECYLDFATIWDQYKTLIPLIQTVWPDRGASIINSLVNLIEYTGRLQNGYLLEPGLHSMFAEQGVALAYPPIAHAAVMNLPGIDWQRTANILDRALRSCSYPESGKHGVDYATAAFAMTRIARRAGDSAMEKRWQAEVNTWRNYYTFPEGKVTPGPFYEGERWNYSFAVWHDLEGLAEMHGGKENLLSDLDCFFHLPSRCLRDVHRRIFGSDELPQQQRFEGLNNEADMETPYLYALLGQTDRAAEVVRCVLKHRFTMGPGGLPGNEDSGALSSWYVWSALGLFPVVGQNRWLIVSPTFRDITLYLGDCPLRIVAPDASEENIYVHDIRLNGRQLARNWLTWEELVGGGELFLKMMNVRQTC